MVYSSTRKKFHQLNLSTWCLQAGWIFGKVAVTMSTPQLWPAHPRGYCCQTPDQNSIVSSLKRGFVSLGQQVPISTGRLRCLAKLWRHNPQSPLPRWGEIPSEFLFTVTKRLQSSCVDEHLVIELAKLRCFVSRSHWRYISEPCKMLLFQSLLSKTPFQYVHRILIACLSSWQPQYRSHCVSFQKYPQVVKFSSSSEVSTLVDNLVELLPELTPLAQVTGKRINRQLQ